MEVIATLSVIDERAPHEVALASLKNIMVQYRDGLLTEEDRHYLTLTALVEYSNARASL